MGEKKKMGKSMLAAALAALLLAGSVSVPAAVLTPDETTQDVQTDAEVEMSEYVTHGALMYQKDKSVELQIVGDAKAASADTETSVTAQINVSRLKDATKLKEGQKTKKSACQITDEKDSNTYYYYKFTPKKEGWYQIILAKPHGTGEGAGPTKYAANDVGLLDKDGKALALYDDSLIYVKAKTAYYIKELKSCGAITVKRAAVTEMKEGAVLPKSKCAGRNYYLYKVTQKEYGLYELYGPEQREVNYSVREVFFDEKNFESHRYMGSTRQEDQPLGNGYVWYFRMPIDRMDVVGSYTLKRYPYVEVKDGQTVALQPEAGYMFCAWEAGFYEAVWGNIPADSQNFDFFWKGNGYDLGHDQYASGTLFSLRKVEVSDVAEGTRMASSSCVFTGWDGTITDYAYVFTPMTTGLYEAEVEKLSAQGGASDFSIHVMSEDDYRVLKKGVSRLFVAGTTYYLSVPKEYGWFMLTKKENVTEELADAGSDGNVTWKLDKNGTLTFSGQGATLLTGPSDTYSVSAGSVPKESAIRFDRGPFCSTAVKKIVIGDDVTQIGQTGKDTWDFPKAEEIKLGKNTTSIPSCGKLKVLKKVTASNDWKPAAFAGSFEGTRWYNTKKGFAAVNNIILGYNGQVSNLVIPESAKGMAAECFLGRKDIKKVTVPGGVTTIPQGAFQSCPALKNVVVQNGVKTIGDKAFWNCKSLKTVTIPKSVTKIGSGIVGLVDGTGNLPTIICYKNSAAHKYAKEHKIPYKLLEK